MQCDRELYRTEVRAEVSASLRDGRDQEVANLPSERRELLRGELVEIFRRLDALEQAHAITLEARYEAPAAQCLLDQGNRASGFREPLPFSLVRRNRRFYDLSR